MDISKKYTFQFLGKEYSLSLSTRDLAYHCEFTYDEQCQYEGDDDYKCNHDYGRCRVLKNISKEGMDYYGLLQGSLTPFDETVKDLVTDALIPLDLAYHVDGEVHSDYYGENLEKKTYFNEETFEKIGTALKEVGLKKVVMNDT